MYKTFSQEEITFEDRDERELDNDISLYAKVAANNAEVDAPKGQAPTETHDEKKKEATKHALQEGEPDPDNWF